MRTKLKGLLATLLAAALLCGCSNGGTATESVVITSEPTDSTTKTTEAAETTAPQTEKIQLSDYTEAIEGGDDSVRRVNGISFRPSWISRCGGGKCAVVGSDENNTAYVAVINTEYGTVTEGTPDFVSDSDAMYFSVFNLGGFFALLDACGTLTTFNDKLEAIDSKTFEFPNSDYITGIASSNSSMLIGSYGSPDFSLVTVDEGGMIQSKSFTVPTEENESVQYTSGAVSKTEFLFYMLDLDTFNSSTVLFDTEKGTVTRLALGSCECMYTIGGKIIITDTLDSTVDVFSPTEPNIKKTFSYPEGAQYIDNYSDGDSIFFYLSNAERGTTSLLRYSLTDGSCTASTELPSNDTWLFFALEYGEKVFFYGNVNNETGIYIWTPEEITAERYGYDMLVRSDFAVLNPELAKKIHDDYGIDVYYGKEGVKYFDCYAVVTETDEKNIYRSLVSLDKFFSGLPEGFTRELISSSPDIDKMNIYLTGSIVPDTSFSEAISDAGAFAYQDTDCENIVINITNGVIDTTLAHELMHIIENVMMNKLYLEGASEEPYEIFSRWSMLNPDGFEYYMTYTDENGQTLGYNEAELSGEEYYDGCGRDIDDIYFVDGYSMTYPSEDYARIFEKIATCTKDNLPTTFRSTHIQLKAAYLCACIRECFDCITDDTTPCWEKTLNPEYTLEYFRSNYDLDAYYAEYAVG